MRKYRLVAKKGEGTFSEVLKAQNVKDGRYHAIKCMKNRFDSIDQVNNLREIQALRRLSPHEHVISLEEVLYDQPTGRLALVFELMDANLYELIRGRRHYLAPNLVKSYIWQLMKSLDHMHKKGIFHRDIKPENILIESSTEIGRGLKLADFGSCRGIYSKQPYTEYISTRWYRAPECLLTDGYYGPEMDLWGAGCVMFEITSLYPLFPGSNEVDQITRIHKILGTPGPEMLAKFKSKGAAHISFDFPPQKGVGIPQLVPHAGADAIDLMVKLLKYDASERITAREAMRHPYFKDVREQEANTANEVKLVSSQTTQGGGIINNQVVITGGASQFQVTGGSEPPSKAGTQIIEKPLPYLNSNSNISGHQQQQQQQQQGGGYVVKSNNINNTILTNTTNSTVATNLPPIAMGAGGTQFSKFGGVSGQPNMMQVQMKSSGINGGTASTVLTSGNNSQYNNSQYTNSQKRRKKYKMNYAQPSQQQKQRAAQNSESVMKAYGVPKSENLINNKPIYPNIQQQSQQLNTGGSVYGGTNNNVGASGSTYGVSSNRHHVKKN